MNRTEYLLRFKILGRKYKNFIRLILYYSNIFINIIIGIKRTAIAKDMVYVNLNLNFNRYLISLIIYFLETDHTVVLQIKPHFFYKWDHYFQKLLTYEQFTLSVKPPGNYHLYISDKPSPGNKFNSLIIDPDYFNKESKNHYHFPFTLHPNMFFKKVTTAFNNHFDKKILIGLAGNFSSIYNDIQVKNEHLLSRRALVSIVINAFSNHVIVPKSKDSYRKLLTSGKLISKIVIIDRRNFDLDHEEYLAFLSSCHFSLCPPGVEMPYCHNLIESLFVGCIPILQYAHLMHPPLKNNFNCIQFQNKIQLIEIVKKIITNFYDVKKIGNNAMEYYNSHVEPHAVISKIKKLLTRKDSKLYLLCGNAGEESINLANSS